VWRKHDEERGPAQDRGLATAGGQGYGPTGNATSGGMPSQRRGP
jgi:hypothetical protein